MYMWVRTEIPRPLREVCLGVCLGGMFRGMFRGVFRGMFRGTFRGSISCHLRKEFQMGVLDRYLSGGFETE